MIQRILTLTLALSIFASFVAVGVMAEIVAEPYEKPMAWLLAVLTGGMGFACAAIIIAAYWPREGVK